MKLIELDLLNSSLINERVSNDMPVVANTIFVNLDKVICIEPLDSDDESIFLNVTTDKEAFQSKIILQGTASSFIYYSTLDEFELAEEILTKTNSMEKVN